jgi:hypothetical protein
MTLPGFNAEASLSKPGRHYRTTPMGFLSASQNHVAPQFTKWRSMTKVLPDGTICWCSEPDTSTVCTSSGCTEKLVCLQWICPPKGQELDDGDDD